MNDSDLEDQLRALSPVAPSADLAARIGRQLAAPAPSAPTAGVLARPARAVFALSWWRNLGWAGAGAAVALAGVLFFSTAQRVVTPAATAQKAVTLPTTPSIEAQAVANAAPVSEDQAFEPAETSRELIAVNKSNELLETEDGTVREVRYTYLERLAWAHPGTGARLEIEVPREDVYLMPVSLQ